MENRDEIAARFPEPRDDEPSSLRDDIVDELADHLQCAAGRENAARHGQGDEAGKDAVASAVLERFGDPSVVARRLWFDGMKEKLMTQRLTIATLLFVFVVTMGMCLATWRNMASLPARNAQLEQANAELLQELRALMASAEADSRNSGAPAEWSHLQVKCVLDTPDGTPVKQVRVQLASDSESSSRMPPFDEQTDAQGLIDFGQVLFGSYRMDVTTPYGATLSRKLAVHPGRSKLETLVCPSQGTAPVHLNLVKKGVSGLPEHVREKLWWRLMLHPKRSGEWASNSGTSAVVYITPRGQYAVVFWKNSQSSNKCSYSHTQPKTFCGANDVYSRSYANHLELADTLTLPTGQYILTSVSICMPSSSDETGRTMVELVEMATKASSAESYNTMPAIIQLVDVGLDRTDPISIELATDLARVRRLHLAANVPAGMQMVSMYAELADGIECQAPVDVSVRFPANDGGLAAPLRTLTGVTLASVTPSRSTKPTFPQTVLMLSEEETDILNLARFTGRLTITPHESQGLESPRIADSPFRELNKRARALGLPDDMKLIAVPALSEVADDETSESTSNKEPTVGAYVKLVGKVALGHSYNTIVTIPQAPRSWADEESGPLLLQGVATTPKEFQPRYQVYLLQARKEEGGLQVRMHDARVEQVAAGPASLW
jgi:hypothetical protein